MSDNLSDFLQTPMDDIKDPAPYPAGTYYGVIFAYSFVTSQKKKTNGLQIDIRVESAGDDVDQMALTEVDISERPVSKTFWLTEKMKPQIKRFIESLSINSAGRSLADCIPEILNARVMFTMVMRTNDQGRPFSEVNNVYGVE